jgi:hypothetical protein
MIMRCLQALALVCMHSALIFALSAARGPAAALATDKYQMWRADAAQILSARGDAGSLATAAALSFAARRPGAVEMAARASELDPGNPSIGWLRLQLCANTPGCDIRDAATAMRWIDAENSAAWLPTLAAAQKDKDAVETDRILTDMARGVRFDLYWNRTVVLLFDALKKAGGTLPANYLPSDLSRLSEAVGITGAEVIPPFAPLFGACRDPADAERRDSCLKLSKIMQRGDTVIVQMAGFSMERRLSPPDSKEARTVAEHRRVLEYRVSTAGQFDEPMLPWLRSARARARIAQMRDIPREEDLDIAILRKRKMPLEPPEDTR